MDMQHLLLLGRATADSELLTSKEKGKNFAVFTVAANRYLGKSREAEVTYFDCICFAANADKLVERVKKGDKVFVQGRPTAEAYVNKKGEAIGKLKVVVENWDVLK